MIKLELPFPPSVNSYWRYTSVGNKKGRHIISPAGQKFKSMACTMIAKQLMKKPVTITADVEVNIVFHKPDKKIRDLDNLVKALFDVITQMGIWKDDSLVSKMTVQWGENIKGGKTVIEIETRN